MPEGTPEAIALDLLKIITNVEGKDLGSAGSNKADRAWILDTYAECLQATTGRRPPKE
jgi:hypothetical protein